MARKPAEPEAQPASSATDVPILDLRRLPLASLVPNPRNAQVHDEKQIERIMASLRDRAQYKPIGVRAANRMIITGHATVEAMRRLAMPAADCILLDVSEAEADAMMIADNRLADLSHTDKGKLAELLKTADPRLLFGIGFSEEEAKDVFAVGDKEEVTVRRVDTSAVSDTFWIQVTGPLRDQADILQRLKILLGERQDVSIEIGTVADVM